MIRKSSKITPKNRINKDKKQGFSSPLSSTDQSPAQRNASDMVGLFKKEFCCIICEEVVSPFQRKLDQENEQSLNGEFENGQSVEDPIVKCRGGCHNTYHLSCAEEDKETKHEDWKCKECLAGQHSCFICNEPGTNELSLGITEKCSQAGCGKYFHRLCLKKYGLWPQSRYSEHALTCPGHICHTCASDNPKDPYMKYNTKLLRCIRCPTAYHSGDHCVAAGMVNLSRRIILNSDNSDSWEVGNEYKELCSML